jgi:hypothetical protein
MAADEPVNLDTHRGLQEQKSTEIRRHRQAIEEEYGRLRQRQEELEAMLNAAPAQSWNDVAEKARYLINLFAATPEARDPRRVKLIEGTLADLARLSGEA